MKRVVLLVAILVGMAAGAGLMWLNNRGASGADTLPRAERAPSPRGNESAGAPAAAVPTPDRGDSAAATARPTAPRRARATPPPAAPAEPAAPAAPTTATLRIVSDVPGAQVFLNREFVGASPAVAKALKPGTYQLNVAAPGFDNHVESLELEPGEREVRINFREIRLEASLEVVHRHRFGSCKGRLVATPQGIRYETTDKDDAFSAALLDLETFQVDYLNKNLRIQPRKGKRYDFTDPDGNADRLFVFHRDVDRARERMKP